MSLLLLLPFGAVADEGSAGESPALAKEREQAGPGSEDKGSAATPNAVKTTSAEVAKQDPEGSPGKSSEQAEKKAETPTDSKDETPERNATKPPYHRPEHAVAVHAKTVNEGTLVLAQMDPKERAELLEKGLVLASDHQGDEDLAGYVRAWVIAEQPRAKVFELLIQPSAQSTFLPRLVSSTTVERKATSELTRFHVRVGLINVHTQVLHQWWPEISRLAWALDPNFDNGVRHQEGYWNVYALDDKTSLLEYGTILKTSALVPKFVQDRLTRSDLPGAMEAMKKYLDSGGTWRR